MFFLSYSRDFSFPFFLASEFSRNQVKHTILRFPACSVEAVGKGKMESSEALTHLQGKWGSILEHATWDQPVQLWCVGKFSLYGD